MSNNAQLELEFKRSNAARDRANRRQRRSPHAALWFAHMRAVVARAREWTSQQPEFNDQTWLRLLTGRGGLRG